jgi:hypothetical protein
MRPEVRQFIKMLRFDGNQPAGKAALKTYFPATVRASSYPNLLSEDVPGLAVKAYLVTYDYNLQDTRANMSKFARSLCQNFATLQASGHPKWKEVELAMPDPGVGWTYFSQTSQELRQCIAAKPKPRPKCALEHMVLGLCPEK